jgi:hypothetical protein
VSFVKQPFNQLILHTVFQHAISLFDSSVSADILDEVSNVQVLGKLASINETITSQELTYIYVFKSVDYTQNNSSLD